MTTRRVLGARPTGCVRTRRIQRITGGCREDVVDSLVEECVVRVYVNGREYCAMACSPWDVEELVVGHLFLEGVVGDVSELAGVRYDNVAGRVYVDTRAPEVTRLRA